MSSLAKRIIVVVVAGLGAGAVATYFGHKDGDARFAAATARIDGECRAYRALPQHRHAAVCHAGDDYAPKALPVRREATVIFDDARTKLAHGDARGGEAAVRRALATADDVQRVGTGIAQLVASSIVKDALDILSAHPELDARSILRDVHIDSARHPFEAERLQWQWMLAHWNELPGASPARTKSDLADAIDASEAAFSAMKSELLGHHDVAACVAAAKKQDEPVMAPVLCEKMLGVLDTAARLDAARR